MAQPLLQLLQAQHPQALIEVLASPWVAPVWRAMAQVATGIEAPFRHGALQLRERRAFARTLQARAYDMAYVLPNTLKFALIPWLAGIPVRVGYRGEMRYGLINVMHRDDAPVARPMVSFYAALAQSPSLPALPPSALPRPSLQVTDEAIHRTLDEVGLCTTSELIVFAAGAEFGPSKRWPVQHFSALAKKIQSARPNAQIVLLGSAKDRELGDAIVAQADGVKNLAGVTSLSQAIDLIAQAKAVVSNDSGLLHIASALNRPVVALYGSTDAQHAPPFSDQAVALTLSLACAPCRQRVCPLGHHRCMEDLLPQQVWQSLQPMLLGPTDA
jgi:heptosyltransferase-2